MFRPYVCAILIRIKSWLKMLELEFWFFVLAFPICLWKKNLLTFVICKDAKAIHQLTLHDKSYTGFFQLLLQTNILSYQWLAGGFWNGKEMSEWLFWGQWIKILQSLKAMLSELKVHRRPEKLFCSWVQCKNYFLAFETLCSFVSGCLTAISWLSKHFIPFFQGSSQPLLSHVALAVASKLTSALFSAAR